MYRLTFVFTMMVSVSAFGQKLQEHPRLGHAGITQEEIASGNMPLDKIRAAGRKVFATPFNKADGYGDGPMNPQDTTSFGGRPTLQNNGTFLRINGLDGQTCLECHFMLSNAVVPARFGVGGFAGSVSNAMFMPTDVDVDDESENGFAAFNGRFINPPFLFGSGGVELVGKEMTAELQALRAEARQNPGGWVTLKTKGVDFGRIRYVDGAFDTSEVVGVDSDLVVRPFGRKGEFPTTRSFDVDAMQFHFGMQPVEAVGADVDADGDGVVNEVTVGELSALAIFNTTLPRPRQQRLQGAAQRGAELFHQIGCADCHIPALSTNSPILTYSFPEVATEPFEHVFFAVDLREKPPGFRPSSTGGIVVPLFADLKRHDMGPALAESFGGDLDSHFTTARLWGVADTGPWLHDGRALSLPEAILLHGGEAQAARDSFETMTTNEQESVIAFLQSLRTPKHLQKDD
jgi:hypothetical protein